MSSIKLIFSSDNWIISVSSLLFARHLNLFLNCRSEGAFMCISSLLYTWRWMMDEMTLADGQTECWMVFFQGEAAGDLWPGQRGSAELSCNDRLLFFSHHSLTFTGHPLSWSDEEEDERMTAPVNTKSSHTILDVWVTVALSMCVSGIWKQYINILLYWGGSTNLHGCFSPVCINETGIDMQTTEWWWENNRGLKDFSFIMVYCLHPATILWTDQWMSFFDIQRK